MTPLRPRYRCLFCGTSLNAWLPRAKAPNSALLLGHLGQQHLDPLRPSLARMETACLDAVLLECFTLVEAPSAWCPLPYGWRAGCASHSVRQLTTSCRGLSP